MFVIQISTVSSYLEAFSWRDTIVIDAFKERFFRVLRSEEGLGRLVPSQRFVDLVDGVGHVVEALHEQVIPDGQKIKSLSKVFKWQLRGIYNVCNGRFSFK